MGPHAPQPNLGLSDPNHRLVVEEPPSRPASPIEFDADHEYQVVHPPPPSLRSASPAETDHEMVDVPPSSPVSSTNPDRRSMDTGSPLENLLTVSDAMKGNAKESHRVSGTARDVRNAAKGVATC